MEENRFINQVGKYNSCKFEQIKNNDFFLEEENVASIMHMGIEYYKHIIKNVILDDDNPKNSYIMWLFDKVSKIDLSKKASIVYSEKVLPDYDIDFPASRREEVIDYIRSKYGQDRVAGVVTFSTLQGKNAIKDVLRVCSACSFSESNKITELIPSRDKISDKLAEFKEELKDDPRANSILFYCLLKEPDLLKDWCYLDEDGKLSGDMATYFGIAIGLEGAIKSESKHASALIIANRPIVEVAPLIRDKSSDELLVGLDMNSFGDVSLAKFDILGIKSLDCLTEVNQLLKEIGIVNTLNNSFST